MDSISTCFSEMDETELTEVNGGFFGFGGGGYGFGYVKASITIGGGYGVSYPRGGWYSCVPCVPVYKYSRWC